MLISIEPLLANLALTRPVFHSESDFQHALAWEIQRSILDANVRLELPVDSGGQRIHVDVRVAHGTATLFLELKYKTCTDTIEHNGERFLLKGQGAQDTGRYDCVRDICRLERLVDTHPGSSGCAILLTNDWSYWKGNDATRAQDAAFRLSEGRILSGELAWAEHAGSGSIRGREMPHRLRSSYSLAWRDYSQPASGSGRPFRALILQVVATC